MAFWLQDPFFRQFSALFRKNWIVLSKHKSLNLLRCLILPIGYGIFLAVAQVFLTRQNNYGFGTPAPIPALADVYDPSLALIWADSTNASSSNHPSAADVMNIVVQSLKPEHRSSVRQVASPDDIPPACLQNFKLLSECYAAITFTSFPIPYDMTSSFNVSNATSLSHVNLVTYPPNGTEVQLTTSFLNYTIRTDAGLGFIDVVNHGSDFERRVLPLQWAIDTAIIQLQTGLSAPPTPLEWPFSIETNQGQELRIRLSYIRGLRILLVLALFMNFLGISYHLPGSCVTERTNGLTPHLRAMGLRDLPRITSWHASISLAYLPGWILTAIIWQFRVFSGTNVGLMIVLHLLTGLSLGSYSFFVSLPPFHPSLSASTSTLSAVIIAVLALVMSNASTATASLFILLFPPSFYIFSIRAIAGFEIHQLQTSVLTHDPDNGLMLLPLMLVALLDVFIYPFISVCLERHIYDAHDPPKPSTRSWFRSKGSNGPVSIALTPDKIQTVALSVPSTDSPAIVVKHLVKEFRISMFPTILRPWHWFSHDAETNPDIVTAIEDLSFTVPRGGIFVLLGSNGAGKSTALSILAGLIGRSGGSVVFPQKDATSKLSDKEAGGGVVWEGPSRPSKGVLGIVPQKNVLFPELTCFQTMQLWSAVKRPHGYRSDNSLANPRQTHVEETPEELERLLIDCGLEGKVYANAGSLSGGQKRKLQLAIGLVGGSEIVLVDECTSGVDPLSRRSVWRTLTAVKHERTIVFTTHFLDEADFLADHIAILAGPGKLVAEGSPVALKSSLGKGYTVEVSFNDDTADPEAPETLLRRIRDIAPLTTLSSSPTGAAYCLHSKDSGLVKQVLETIQNEQGKLNVTGYDIHGTTIEDIFLDIMAAEDSSESNRIEEKRGSRVSSFTLAEELDHPDGHGLQLTSGQQQGPLTQSHIIFYKRCLVARRSWLSPALTVVIAVAGACIPLFFMNNRAETCVTTFRPAQTIPLYLGNSPYSGVVNSQIPGAQALISPPNLVSTLGVSADHIPFRPIPDNNTFVTTVQRNFQNLSLGGVSMDLNTRNILLAWEATPPGLTAPTLLNLASNVLYNQALNASGRSANQTSIIAANYQRFPAINAGTLVALKWVAFFGATMGVFPAFFTIYVSLERRLSVQAMQFSNGLTNPAGLWLGHLLFDGVLCTILATIIIVIFTVASNQFHGLGYFWLVLVLYGLASALFSYCVSVFAPSPLAAFAAAAGYQVVIFIVYLAGYLLTATYAKNSKAAGIITIINFTVSLCSPVASVLRAAFVSINLFSLLCDNGRLSAASLGHILKFGGPIIYLIVDCLVLFCVLVYFDSGSVLPRCLQVTRPHFRDVDKGNQGRLAVMDVTEETKAVETSNTDLLRVLHVSKTFDRSPSKAVDNVSFGVSRDTVFAMLGPNGAGKTSTFDIIRGDIYPDSGDVLINGASIITHPNAARLSLGVCPQFTAIDPQLTVRQHLVIYGLLKGLRKGPELQQNVDALLRVTTLNQYADRLAIKLSGGNQRKLAFAIAFIGNPTVILIDEYSTGIDAATKRDMWITFRRMAIGKALVITTHSMEEASALATKVGILAGRMLAVGTPEVLAGRYALYQVHFPARTREDVVTAQALMKEIPGSRMADDVATRFEIPIRTETTTRQKQTVPLTGQSTLSLAQLFQTLSTQNHFAEYTVERISLESVFLKVIREHNFQEEDTISQTRQQATKGGRRFS